jgi:SAM-dependent methyltransferase
MRTDIVDLHDFYASPLGARARDSIAARICEAWPDRTSLRIAGFGHTEPYLERLCDAERLIALAPASQGVVRWPHGERNSAVLAGETTWPLPDASVDRLLIVHGLEESADPHRLMREAWRVLTSDGQMIVVVSHRRGLWSAMETTPFAAGRPYLKGQLNRLLQGAMFRALAWSSALYFPPVGAGFLLRGVNAWERAGENLWPALCGVLLVDSAKDMAQPIAKPLRAGLRIGAPVRTASRALRVNGLGR